LHVLTTTITTTGNVNRCCSVILLRQTLRFRFVLPTHMTCCERFVDCKAGFVQDEATA